jgi:hypothetical protein
MYVWEIVDKNDEKCYWDDKKKAIGYISGCAEHNDKELGGTTYYNEVDFHSNDDCFENYDNVPTWTFVNKDGETTQIFKLHRITVNQ